VTMRATAGLQYLGKAGADDCPRRARDAAKGSGPAAPRPGESAGR
jgi:hypothetical protein